MESGMNSVEWTTIHTTDLYGLAADILQNQRRQYSTT